MKKERNRNVNHKKVNQMKVKQDGVKRETRKIDWNGIGYMKQGRITWGAC